MSSKMTFADLFAGIGGMRIGFERAGFNAVYSNDCDTRCKETYETNFGVGSLDCREIQDVASDEIPDVEIILAGFPCQPFSVIGKRMGFQDKRGNAFYELARVIKAKKPRVIVLENVQNIGWHDKGATMEIIKDVLENQLGYFMNYKILNSKDFGLPQNRKRMYMVGFIEPVNFSFPKESHQHLNVGDILERDGIEDKYYLTQKYLEGLQKHKERHRGRGHGFGFEVLSTEGVANALVVGNMGRERNLINDKVLQDSYEEGDDKALKRNREGIRRLTVRECARLQGFPDDYIFPVPFSVAYKQLGNAVSTSVAEAVAIQVREALLREPSKIDQRSHVVASAS